MLQIIDKLGRFGLKTCWQLGCAGVFLLRILCQVRTRARFWSHFSRQLYRVGVQSLLIIILSAAFIGLVVALQGHHTLQKFSAEAALGQLLALSVVRELGPVVSALLFIGRAGSSLTAELGLMRTTDQLSAMNMMGVDPYWRILVPRFWACILALPLLTMIFDWVAIMAGAQLSIHWLGVDAGAFWSGMQSSVVFATDVLNGLIKSLAFAMLIVWIALYQGYTCPPNARGMARATTRTVVQGSVLILVFDFILTSTMMGGW